MKLAELGETNVRRSLLKAFKVPDTMPEATKIRVPHMPIRNPKDVPEFTDTTILLPNLIIEHMYRHFRKMFQNYPGDGLANIWNNVKADDPKLINHPILGIDGYKDKAIPLLLHGDGVQFTMKNNSLLTVQFSPLLAKGWSWESIWLSATWPKNCRAHAFLHGPYGDT